MNLSNNVSVNDKATIRTLTEVSASEATTDGAKVEPMAVFSKMVVFRLTKDITGLLRLRSIATSTLCWSDRPPSSITSNTNCNIKYIPDKKAQNTILNIAKAKANVDYFVESLKTKLNKSDFNKIYSNNL